MSLKQRVQALEKQAAGGDDWVTLCICTDDDRDRLRAMRGGRVFVLAAEAERPLVEEARQRGVRVDVLFFGGNISPCDL